MGYSEKMGLPKLRIRLFLFSHIQASKCPQKQKKIKHYDYLFDKRCNLVRDHARAPSDEQIEELFFADD